jgi:hypothetical protein
MKIKNLQIFSALALSLLLPFGASAVTETVKKKSYTRTPHKTVTRETTTQKKSIAGKTALRKEEKAEAHTTNKAHHAKAVKHPKSAHKSVAHNKAVTHRTPATTHSAKNRGWGLGAGALGAGAVTGAYTGYKQPYSSPEIHRHYGPRNWNSSFPTGWNHGFVWGKHNGQTVFGGHPIKWWETHYPEYYERSLKPELNAAMKK